MFYIDKCDVLSRVKSENKESVISCGSQRQDLSAVIFAEMYDTALITPHCVWYMCGENANVGYRTDRT